MPLEIPIENRNIINLEKPTFTLDVNQIALRNPSVLPQEYEGLIYLEWNYNVPESVELCVTPQTQLEITQGVPVSELGSVAYERLIKSEFYKRRPPGITLDLTTSDSDAMWTDMRLLLFPNVADELLSSNQKADVNQIIFHTVSSGLAAVNSIFVTGDNNFLNNNYEFENRYGVTILTPNDAWDECWQPYSSR